MCRRLLSLVLIPVLLLAGLVPATAAVSSGSTGHACCRTLQASAPHEGCPQPVAARMRCCAPEPERNSGTQIPPASGAPLHPPDFTLLKGHAAHVPGLTALVGASVAHAFEFARLKLPHDPLYLRNVLLLV